MNWSQWPKQAARCGPGNLNSMVHFPGLVDLCVFSICNLRPLNLITEREQRISWTRSHSSTLGEVAINKNQVKGEIKNLEGKVEEEAGKLVGNKEQQVKGLQKQVEGKAQKKLGDVKDAKDALKDAVKKH